MGSETYEAADDRTGDQLQDLVLASPDVEHFLHELAVFTADRLSHPGQRVLCGITLMRCSKPVSVASSDDDAKLLDKAQNAFNDGPCLMAIRGSTTVLVPDVLTEQRWMPYMNMVRNHGIRSILGVPLFLEGEAGAALNLYAEAVNGFSGEAIESAERYALRASKSLNVSMRMASLSDSRDNLKAALESRTTIDLAVGVIMGQNRCSQEAAFKILKNASNARNVKLHQIAAMVVASASGGEEVSTHYDE